MTIKINTIDRAPCFHTPTTTNSIITKILQVITFPINNVSKIFSSYKTDKVLGKPFTRTDPMFDIDRIYKAGQRVYLGFILLDMINDKGNNYFVVNDKKGLSLNEYVSEMVKHNVFNKDVKIGKITCKISIVKTSRNAYRIEIGNGTQFRNSNNNLKAKNKYNDQDFIILCNTHELTFTCDNNRKYAFSTKIGEHTIGGPNKIDLYPIHISNLYQMIDYANSNAGNINTLVAMTTGSGKSFTQALWVFVLHCAGYRGVFAVPQKALVNQLAEDFNRLLPRTITETVKICDLERIDNTDLDSHIITTHDILFKQSLHEFKNKKYWISIDEAHYATEIELYKKAIETLENPIFFLTATPTKFNTEFVGHIINLSPKEKEQQGLCKRTVIITRTAQPRIPKATYIPSIAERLSLSFADIIEKERLSTAHECLSSIEECVLYRKPTDPFFVKITGSTDESIRSNLRWNVHLPLGEKLLGLLGPGNCNGVINFHLALNSTNISSAYENGNRVKRRNVYNFFLLSLLSPHEDRLDEAHLESYETSKKEFRQSRLCNYLMNQYNFNSEQAKYFIEENLDYANNAASYRELSVLHGIIENTISYLTNYNSIELNHKRYHDLTSLAQEIKAQLSAISSDQHKEQILNELLHEGIPDSIATTISIQISVVLDTLTSYKDDDFFFGQLVDNWSLDRNLHDNYFGNGPLSRLQGFCKKHKTIFLVNGLKKTPLQVSNNRPFFGLQEGTFNLQQDGNQELKTITKHKLSTIEALDDTTEQYYYTPEYCPREYTETAIDKLFKKGLIGAYITSEKTTGFNDVNLCTIGVVVDSTEESINAPRQLIQSNRNRGLDWAKQPTYHLATKPEVKLSFDIRNLTKENYTAALNIAEKRHNQELVTRLGSKIAEQIQDYIDLNTDLFGKIDSSDMENKFLEIIWNEYEYLYIQNNHNPEKTKHDFIHILNDTHKILNASEDTIKKSYQISISARVIGCVLELIANVIYFLTTYSLRREFRQAAKALEDSSNNDLMRERTYTHIVQNYRYKDIISTSFATKMLFALVQKKFAHCKDFSIRNPNKFIKEEKKIELNKKIKILLNQITTATTNLTPDQKEEISQYVATKDDWINEIFNLYRESNTIMPSDMVFNLVSRDPNIRQYLQREKIIRFEIPLHQIPSTATAFFSIMQEADINSEVEIFLVKSVAHYFQSKVFLKLFNKYILPLENKHLLAILNAIYPDSDNKNKLDNIRRFGKGINSKKQFAEIVKECGGIQEISEILKYLGEIAQELLHCYCYYHNMGEKGEANLFDQERKNSLITPKLYKSSRYQEHNIWNIWVSKHPLTCIYKKAQFLSGSLSSLRDIGEVSYLDYKPKMAHVQSIAQKLQELAKCLIGPGCNCKMEKVALQLRDLKPLENFLHYNAVQQALASYNRENCIPP